MQYPISTHMELPVLHVITIGLLWWPNKNGDEVHMYRQLTRQSYAPLIV